MSSSLSSNHPIPEFLNRELSWLHFNERVLHEALDARTPLLERVRFLSIFNSNLDEFVMKRVGGLKRQIAANVQPRSSHEPGAHEQLTLIRSKIKELLAQQGHFINEHLRSLLKEHHIHLLKWDELNAKEKERAQEFFHSKVFPVLTPLSVDPGHPFPFLSNLSLSLGVLLQPPPTNTDNLPLFARVKIPDVFPTWIRVDRNETDETARFISLHQLITRNLGLLFPGMQILDVMAFRITRNGDIEREEEDADDLLEMIEEELRQRRFAKVVRLEHGPLASPQILDLLKTELELNDNNIYEHSVPLDELDLKELTDLRRPELKFKPIIPAIPAPLLEEEVDFFSLIRKRDLLVHHPYESFNATVERFIENAVDDPKVMAIKMIIYRTGQDSPFIPLLIRAAESGKQVVCLVELKARFDEAKNILVAQALERAGVHVVYGIVGLKTHSKVALVVRQEAKGVCCYAHIGTGNYNAQTARVYTDLGLFTAKPEFTADVVNFFHYLTGRSLYQEYQKLLVAPVALKSSFLSMIENEITLHQKGEPAQIIAKMNSLEDKEICRALYRASQEGVKIDLIVRGFCCLRPGVPGMSENIRVISVIGQFLEHSRVFYFRSGSKDPAKGCFYIGSADWMYRNLSARVEVVAPIEDIQLKRKILEFLTLLLKDQRQTWEMHPDGTYTRRRSKKSKNSDEPLGVQTQLMKIHLAKS